jgi:hypothetical protein
MSKDLEKGDFLESLNITRLNENCRLGLNQYMKDLSATSLMPPSTNLSVLNLAGQIKFIEYFNKQYFSVYTFNLKYLFNTSTRIQNDLMICYKYIIEMLLIR